MAADSPHRPDERRRPDGPGAEPDGQAASEGGETLAEKIRRYRQPDAAPRRDDRASRERGDG